MRIRALALAAALAAAPALAQAPRAPWPPWASRAPQPPGQSAAPPGWPQAERVCAPDLNSYCPDQKPGLQLGQCLRENLDMRPECRRETFGDPPTASRSPPR